jgi:hypothetical protein
MVAERGLCEPKMRPYKSEPSADDGQQGHHLRSAIGQQGHPNDDSPFLLEDPDDYQEWRRRMVIELQKLSLWDIMAIEFSYEEESTPGWIKKNNQAVATMDIFMSDSIADCTADFDRAADIWQALEIQLYDTQQPAFWEEDEEDHCDSDYETFSFASEPSRSDDVANNQCKMDADESSSIGKTSVPSVIADEGNVPDDCDKNEGYTSTLNKNLVAQKLTVGKDLAQKLTVGKGARLSVKVFVKNVKCKFGAPYNTVRNNTSKDQFRSLEGLFKRRPPKGKLGKSPNSRGLNASSHRHGVFKRRPPRGNLLGSLKSKKDNFWFKFERKQLEDQIAGGKKIENNFCFLNPRSSLEDIGFSGGIRKKMKSTIRKKMKSTNGVI